MWPKSWLKRALLFLVLPVFGCSTEPQPPKPRLPEGKAGEVLARAFEAAGGWDRWAELRDVSHVNTLTLFDPFQNVTSESVGLFAAPLHGPMRARMDSIGLANEVRLGTDGASVWILREGKLVDMPERLELTRFNLVATRFWFNLPFSVAEMPSAITDLGERQGPNDSRWHLLKVVFERPNPAVTGEWLVLYFNTKTHLIDRIHTRLTERFLQHELWAGEWIDYRDWNGLKKERQRRFFPANEDGEIIGPLVAEQLVEHVRFDNNFAPEYFDKPVAKEDGQVVAVPCEPAGARLARVGCCTNERSGTRSSPGCGAPA